MKLFIHCLTSTVAPEWISKFIPHFTKYVITSQCWDLSLTMLVKGAFCTYHPESLHQPEQYTWGIWINKSPEVMIYNQTKWKTMCLFNVEYCIIVRKWTVWDTDYSLRSINPVNTLIRITRLLGLCLIIFGWRNVCFKQGRSPHMNKVFSHMLRRTVRPKNHACAQFTLCCVVIRYLPIVPIFYKASSLVQGKHAIFEMSEEITWIHHRCWYNMMTSSNANIFRVTSLWGGNSPVTGEFPSQRPVTRSFDFFICAWING